MSNTAVAVRQSEAVLSLADTQSFEHIQRVAKCLSQSELVPVQYRNNIPNCVLALEVAHRMRASWFAIMQNLNIIHGKPGFNSTFIIGMINSSGRFAPLQFDVQNLGKKSVNGTVIEDKVCIAWTVESGVTLPRDASTLEKAKAAGYNVLESPPVSVEMAVKEGWFTKNGSKWQTMPDLMLRYRAATFFGRLYAADMLLGMRADDEILDMGDVVDVGGPEPEIRLQAEPVRPKRAKVVKVDDPAPEEPPSNVMEMPKQQDEPAPEPPTEAAPQPAPEPEKPKAAEPAPAPKQQGEAPPLHEQLRAFFAENGVGFDELKATLSGRLKVVWMAKYNSFSEMEQKHLNNLWNSRRGALAEALKDKEVANT